MRMPKPKPQGALGAALVSAVLGIAGVAVAWAAPGPAQQRILDHYAAEARAAGESGVFSFKRGDAFFHAKPGTGRPATPSCSRCHTDSPLNVGHTRAGKAIAPMALSKSPNRFSDLKKVEKWFRRNCHSVYGRACTPQEKGNYLTYMTNQ